MLLRMSEGPDRRSSVRRQQDEAGCRTEMSVTSVLPVSAVLCGNQLERMQLYASGNVSPCKMCASTLLQQWCTKRCRAWDAEVLSGLLLHKWGTCYINGGDCHRVRMQVTWLSVTNITRCKAIVFLLQGHADTIPKVLVHNGDRCQRNHVSRPLWAFPKAQLLDWRHVLFISMPWFSQGAAATSFLCGLLLQISCTVTSLGGPHHMYSRITPREQTDRLLQNTMVYNLPAC